MANDGTNFDAAFDIYATMQRNGVEPDDLLYGHLIALAGRCRKLEVGYCSAVSRFVLFQCH
jgi:xylose isomerase